MKENYGLHQNQAETPSRQLAFDFTRAPTASVEDTTERYSFPRTPINTTRPLAGSSSAVVQEIQGEDSKALQRRVVLATADQVEPRLLERREYLVDRKMEGLASPEEEGELELIRWQLDQIDDARFGRDLDELEFLVEREAKLAEDLEAWLKQMGGARLTSKKRASKPQKPKKQKKTR